MTQPINDEQVFAGDHIVRGVASNGMIRAMAITSRATVQEMVTRHQTSPVVTAALGRLMMGAQMMGYMFKSPDELLTILVQGDGPIGSMTVTADNAGNVKGFAAHHDVWLPLKEDGKLDVGGAVGQGTMTVIRDLPHAEPYTSQVELVSGEIGDDLTSYFVISDQIPTVVGVGVLVDRDLSVKQAGGFIVQLMPGHFEYLVDELELNMANIKSVTGMLEDGLTPTGILEKILDGMDFEVLESAPVRFHCGCNDERAERATMALGMAEICDMVEKDEPAEVYCHFCASRYNIPVDQLRELIEE